MRDLAALILLGLPWQPHHVSAQFPPQPEGLKKLKSRFHENVTISYKQPHICETTPGVKSYSGYVHLPAGFLDDGHGDTHHYPINTFFYFIEARHSPHTAPLAIWLNGGPGGSSMMGALEENGPCVVNPSGSPKSTRLNPYSWNNEVNMLYLDQPTQVGFSYDVPTNCTVRPAPAGPLAEPDYEVVPADFSSGVPDVNVTHRVGTFSSQKLNHTANSTHVAAHAFWHFAQTWLAEFPHYKPRDDRISLWAESYGGHYGPAFFHFLEEQNEKIDNGEEDERGAHKLHLDTLGIVNGLMDLIVQAEAWISFPYNNTYGIQIFDREFHDELMHDWSRPGGCRDQYQACRDALRERDGDLYLPHLSRQSSTGHRNKPKKDNVTKACGDLFWNCDVKVIPAYDAAGRGFYDIAHPRADPFPPPYMYGYLSEASTLSALGVPVNFTASSPVVEDRFHATYDIAVGGFLEAIGYLLDRGVKVHMMYGDRDYGCNWVGGEKASLAVPWKDAERFAKAGYMPLVAGDTVAGMTRQVGRYSFTRVFQAGHEVPSYQPEAAYEIFRRATLGLDIPSGSTVVDDEYATEGPRSTWHIKNAVPEMPKPKCYILKPITCLPEVWERFVAGKAVVKDYFVVEEDDEAVGLLDGAEDSQKPIVV
ncbi:carboxypeptidase C [Coniochaeta sp. 2T2.1]|nr:carboxypeptidase C [Coniochaeta sp. 2T2.1]